MIDIRELKLTINNQLLLNEINLKATKGEIVGIIGKSGSGKSALLKTIAGKFREYSGNIRINNIPLNTISDKDLRSFVSSPYRKSSDNYIDDTLLNFLMLSRKHKKRFLNPYREFDFQIVEHNIRQFQLERYKEDKIHSIPDGIYKIAKLAFTFSIDARILLLDNPTSDLDLYSTQLLQKALQKHVIDGDRLSVIASNDLNFISQTADKIILLDRGRITTEGPPDMLSADLIKKHFGLDVLISKNIYNGKPIIHLNLGD